MEGEVARRRISTISGHFSANEDLLSATHLLPMNCSGSLNSVIQRCDNRVSFGRQGSAYQARFMRQVSSEERSAHHCTTPALPKSSCTKIDSSSRNASEAPLFSRPENMDPKIPNLPAIQPLNLDWSLSMPDPPKFSRPNNSKSEEMLLQSRKKTCSRFSANEWSPRMVVAEFGSNFIMTVEIPGVRISDIRVEVDDQNLMVSGQQSTERWKVSASRSVDSISAYQKREISQGPYQVVWELPNNVNKDNISAEFQDGLLRIVIPKI